MIPTQRDRQTGRKAAGLRASDSGGGGRRRVMDVYGGGQMDEQTGTDGHEQSQTFTIKLVDVAES